HAATVMPGFTHLQTAQPVTFGHHLLAYVEMAARDRGRFADARRRLNESPLGAAALARTAFPLDRPGASPAPPFRLTPTGPRRPSASPGRWRIRSMPYPTATSCWRRSPPPPSRPCIC